MTPVRQLTQKYRVVGHGVESSITVLQKLNYQATRKGVENTYKKYCWLDV